LLGKCAGTAIEKNKTATTRSFWGRRLAAIALVASERKTTGRKGIIVFTDGRDTGATRLVTIDRVKRSMLVELETDKRFRDVRQLLSRGGIPAYFFAVNTDKNPNPMVSPADQPNQMQARLRMQQFATVSGGRVAFPQNLEEIVPMYEQIGRELGSADTLSYTPTLPWTTSDHRLIEVRTRRSDVRTHSLVPD
jgi:hypothetical protein